jgi:hypothetical protein
MAFQEKLVVVQMTITIRQQLNSKKCLNKHILHNLVANNPAANLKICLTRVFSNQVKELVQLGAIHKAIIHPASHSKSALSFCSSFSSNNKPKLKHQLLLNLDKTFQA